MKTSGRTGIARAVVPGVADHARRSPSSWPGPPRPTIRRRASERIRDRQIPGDERLVDDDAPRRVRGVLGAEDASSHERTAQRLEIVARRHGGVGGGQRRPGRRHAFDFDLPGKRARSAGTATPSPRSSRRARSAPAGSAPRRRPSIASPLRYFCCGSVSRIVRTPFGSNPRSTRCRLTKLRISRPAPSSRTTDSAISATMSTWRTRLPARPRRYARRTSAIRADRFAWPEAPAAARRGGRRDAPAGTPRQHAHVEAGLQVERSRTAPGSARPRTSGRRTR